MSGDSIGAPFPIVTEAFPGPSADIQPVIGPSKHPQQAIPTLRGASLDPIELKSFVHIIFFVAKAFFRGRVGGPFRGRPLIEPDMWFSHIRLSDDSCPSLGARTLREHLLAHLRERG